MAKATDLETPTPIISDSNPCVFKRFLNTLHIAFQNPPDTMIAVTDFLYVAIWMVIRGVNRSLLLTGIIWTTHVIYSYTILHPRGI